MSLSEPSVEEHTIEAPVPKKRGRPKKVITKTDVKEIPKSPEIICDQRSYLDGKDFDFKWLDSLAKQYGFDKFEYLHKFRSWRCYKEDRHLDWISVNDLSLINGGKRLVEILLKHQEVSPKKAVIQYHWRRA